ncbi:MAG: hypothetical protein IJW16_02090 [Clostridia bacterium]|nr:hypothetical protein [Clostridia bacterium]
MTCKDCGHFVVCDSGRHIGEYIEDDATYTEGVERFCAAFVLKPPCKIGDVLWYVPEEYKDFDVFEGERGFCEIHVTDVGVRHIYFSSFEPPREDVNEAIPIDQIGVTVFYSEEEARQVAEWRRNQ